VEKTLVRPRTLPPNIIVFIIQWESCISLFRVWDGEGDLNDKSS
jgi:hypothetical protein